MPTFFCWASDIYLCLTIEPYTFKAQEKDPADHTD